MARRIALVEDDPTIRQNYADALTRAGYEVAAFADRASASRTLAARLPELAIIDIGLGADIDGGFALCRELRSASSRLPIIFLSARDSDFDIVSGLRCRTCSRGSRRFSAAWRRPRSRRSPRTCCTAADSPLMPSA